jgi:long-chain fatty acid transport protein
MKFRKSLLGVSVAGALLAMSGEAAASAFALIEQSSGLGNAFAGGAAAAEDATTIFFNPAGMSRLNGTQASAAVSAIKPSAKFSDGGSTGAALQTAGGNGGDAGSLAFVPNVYAVTELGQGMRFGLGVNMPFGLKTEYDPSWIGRFQAIKSDIRTININPSISYQVNEVMSLGLGLSYQHIAGELTSAVNYSAAAFSAGGAALLTAIGGAGKEGVTTMSGTDSAWGYNLGALFNATPSTRVGVAYRSKLTYTLKGTINFTNVPAALAASPTFANGDVTLPVDMPDMFSLSAFHQLNDKWDLMADASRTGWGTFQQLVITRTNGTVAQTVQEKWKNTWRFSLGATHHYNEQWLARVGVAYDQTPVPDAYRTARIPDNNRTWLAFGGQYKPSAAGTLDFGYARLFINDASIANNQTASGAGNLVGSYNGGVDILSVQYAHRF